MALEIDDINLGGTLSATTISATTIVFGGQPIQNVFVQNIPGGYLPISGGTVTGETIFNGGLSANTFFSGSTNLYDIFSTGGPGGASTYVQPGSNITTGGTISSPIVSVVDSPSFSSITASGASSFTVLTATTFVSGSTNLYDIFSTGGPGGASTYVQPGSNILTGGTATEPIISLVDSPSVNNITFSGTAIGGNVQAGAGTFTSISANTLSGGTILSGSTNLYSIFAPFGTASGVSSVTPGSNITTGGTEALPIISLVDSPSVNNLTISGLTSSSDGATFVKLSGTTIFVGNSTTGGTIQAEKELVLQQTGDTFGSSILRLRNRNGENGAIFETTDPTITLIDFIFKTSANQRNVRYESRVASSFLTAPEFQFGIAANPALVVNDSTLLVRGSGGTRTTSLSSTTISANTINISGQLTGADGATFANLSGTNIFSGSVNLQTYFNTINGQLGTKANCSGETFTGQVNVPTLSATTLSADTSVFVSSIKFPVSPVSGYILTSDASGNASWAPSPTSGSGTTKLDMQSVSNQTTTPIATSALVDVAGMTLTAKNLGSSATTYYVHFAGDFSNNANAGNSTFRIVRNGTQIPGALTNLSNAGAAMAAANRTVSIAVDVTGVTNGDVIKVQMSASTGTVTARNKSLNIIGTLNANLV